MAPARIMTITGATAQYKKDHPGTCIGEYFLRQLCTSGKLKCHRAGNRYLVDITRLEEYLANPPEEETPVAEHGGLRIQQVGGR